MKIVNFNLVEIVVVWCCGDIDGVFVWLLVLGEIKKSGKVFIDVVEVG